MAALTSRFVAFRETEHFRRIWKYASVSLIATAITQVVLFATYAGIGIRPAMLCNVIATVCASIPAYYLNRTWTWGKTGKSDVWREFIPFWVISFIGLVLSTIAVGVAAHNADHFTHSSLGKALFINFANLATYAAIWIARYMIFNKYLFGPGAREADLEKARAEGASGAGAVAVPAPVEVPGASASLAGEVTSD